MLVPFVIVHDFDVVSVTPAELETYPPRSVHRHGPLVLTIALQLVETDAFEGAKVPKPLGDVQGQKQIHGKLKIQAAHPVWLLAFPNPTARDIAP